MVTAYHLWRYFGFHELNIGPIAVHKLAAFGYAGVDLFFAVSGFAMMLTWAGRAHKSDHPVASFYAARAERIIPPYFVAVGFFSAMSAAGVFQFSHGAWDVLSHLTFIHTLFPTTFFSVSGVFWSLAVEVQFYLLFPFLVRLSERGLLIALLVSTVAALALDYGAPHDGPMSFVYRCNVVGFAPLFLAGMLIQRYRPAVRQSLRRSAGCIFVAIVLMLALPATTTDLYSRLTVGACLAAGLLLFASSEAPRTGARVIRAIALASYSIYLYNYIFIATLAPLVAGWFGAVLYFVGVFAFGMLAWLVVERPVEAMRHHLRARRAKIVDRYSY
jgi:peptidoglycan/LPS O-acetylase OafA/YrhL